MIRAPHPSEFTQGTIFTCAVAEHYDAATVLGLVITARCDVAQEKAEIINYVPVVSIESWMLRDGRQIVAKRAAAEALGGMRSALSEAGMAASILDTMPVREIADELDRGFTKQEKAISTRFAKAAEALDDAAAACAAWLSNHDSFAYLECNERACKSLIKELLGSGIAEFHYLDRVEPGETSNGYVALLREVRFISAQMAKAVSVGLDKEAYGDRDRKGRLEINL